LESLISILPKSKLIIIIDTLWSIFQIFFICHTNVRIQTNSLELKNANQKIVSFPIWISVKYFLLHCCDDNVAYNPNWNDQCYWKIFS
jgi:hypothetical protein